MTAEIMDMKAAADITGEAAESITADKLLAYPSVIESLRKISSRRQAMDDRKTALMKEKVNELIEAPTCCEEARAAAKAWLEACGTDKEADALNALIAELKEDIVTVDGLIAFAESEAGASVFGGAEAAKGVAAHGREIKAAGAKYCDCPACKAVEAILEICG